MGWRDLIKESNYWMNVCARSVDRQLRLPHIIQYGFVRSNINIWINAYENIAVVYAIDCICNYMATLRYLVNNANTLIVICDFVHLDVNKLNFRLFPFQASIYQSLSKLTALHIAQIVARTINCMCVFVYHCGLRNKKYVKEGI